MGMDADERSSKGEWYGEFSERLSAYLERLRLRIGTEPGNIAGTALGEVKYHLEALHRVVDRYRERSQTFVDLHRAFFESVQQHEHPHELTAEEEESLAQRWPVQSELRQEIETFYLFARILLDKMTQALVACLGQGKYAPTSHSKLISKADQYLGEQGVRPVPDELRSLMTELDSTVTDFRDDVIVHDQSARGLRPIGWDRDSKLAYLIYSRLYPRERDEQITGLPPTVVMDTICHYAMSWLDYLESVESNAS